MARPARRILSDFQSLCFHEIPPKSTSQSPFSPCQSDFLNSRHVTSNFSSTVSSPSKIWSRLHSTSIPPKPASQNSVFSRILSQNPSSSPPLLKSPTKNDFFGFFSSGFLKSRQLDSKNPIKLSFFPFRNYSFGKFDAGFRKSAVEKPLSSIKSVVSRYREAVGLQVEAFWKRNYLVLVGAGAVVLCIALWRVMFGVAGAFVGLSEGMAKYGFLALATSIVAFAGLYLRSRFIINPDKIYRMAMRKLNTSAGILEVMGAPLTGTDVRAYVISGGGPKLKNFKLRLGGKRCFLIFPIRGSERRGLVSVEVKKKKGQYDMRLLAVDVPMATGPDQRLFLIGDEQEYKIGGGLISELRDPIVKAMAAEKEFEDLDQKEDEEDEIREREEAERKQREEEESAVEAAERKRHEVEGLEKVSS